MSEEKEKVIVDRSKLVKAKSAEIERNTENSAQKSTVNSAQKSAVNNTHKSTEKSVSKGAGNGKKKVSKKKKTAKQYAISFFIKVGVTALVVVLLLYFVVGVYVNHSNTGYPMVKDGDLCLTFKLAQLHKGDEIAYEVDGTIHFGRIVAEAGEVVDIGDEGLTVNGYGLYEDTVYPTTGEGAKISFPYTVPNDSLFVLNDYRPDATDSRTYGGIPMKDTKGKVVLLLRKRGV